MVIGSIGGGSSGSGGTSMWGQASTAHFHGAGSPVGVVLPSGKGDLYDDDTTPALWQANGATHTDWEQVGAGGATPGATALVTTGKHVTITNGTTQTLLVTTSTTTDPTTLLVHPLTGSAIHFAKSGLYIIAGVIKVTAQLTAGGSWKAAIVTTTFSVSIPSSLIVPSSPGLNVAIPITLYMPIGATIQYVVHNYDGAMTRTFFVTSIIVQRVG